MVDWIAAILIAFWYLIPAYMTNAFPPLAKGKYPLDLGRRMGSSRILGDGKTFEGTFFGLFGGLTAGFIELTFYSDFNNFASSFGVTLPEMTFLLAFLITVGALTGDIVKSFFKRRMGMERGKEMLFWDQLDFVIGMIVFIYWFADLTWPVILVMLLVTPIIHRIACIIGYWLKVKLVPW